MSAFFIWSPSIVEGKSNAIEVVITRGDNGAVSRGTEEFASGILETIGIYRRVVGWQVTPFRSKYFSEYLGEADWRDNWQLVWRVEIDTDAPAGPLPKLKRNGIGTEVVDETWTPAQRLPDDAKVKCLIIADFKTVKARVAAHDAITKRQQNESQERLQDPAFHVALVPPGFEELQIDLGPFDGKFYERGAEYAESIMEICRKHKGSVHFQKQPR